MDSHKKKIILDHARRAGHLVSLWDSKDLSWYSRYKMPKSKKDARRPIRANAQVQPKICRSEAKASFSAATHCWAKPHEQAAVDSAAEKDAKP